MRVIGCVLLLVLSAASAGAQDGSALYAKYCSQCHDSGLPRTPSRQAFSALEPAQIVAALETGTMRTQGAERTAAEKRALAVFLAGRTVGDIPAPLVSTTCSAAPAAGDAHWNGWGASVRNDRFQRDAAAKFADQSKPTSKNKIGTQR